jgi:hypothetical protein
MVAERVERLARMSPLPDAFHSRRRGHGGHRTGAFRSQRHNRAMRRSLLTMRSPRGGSGASCADNLPGLRPENGESAGRLGRSAISQTCLQQSL